MGVQVPLLASSIRVYAVGISKDSSRVAFRRSIGHPWGNGLLETILGPKRAASCFPTVPNGPENVADDFSRSDLRLPEPVRIDRHGNGRRRVTMPRCNLGDRRCALDQNRSVEVAERVNREVTKLRRLERRFEPLRVKRPTVKRTAVYCGPPRSNQDARDEDRINDREPRQCRRGGARPSPVEVSRRAR